MDGIRIFSGKPEAVEDEINEFLQSDDRPKIKDLKLTEFSGSESKLAVLLVYEIPEDEF